MVSGIFVALVAILLLAPLVLHKDPVIKAVGKGLAWTVSVLLVTFFVLVATSIGLKWPSTAASILGIEDGVTCGRPSEPVKAFSCGAADGSYVVVNIRHDDGDYGLMIREAPNLNAPGRPIPPNATGVTVSGACNPEEPNSWCQVQCGSLSLKGWSRSRYLRPRDQALYTVTRTNPTQPDGLTVRSGPHQSCRSTGVLPYQSMDVVEDWCQRSPIDQTFWCRITFENVSGWILDGFLEHQN